MSVLAGAWFLDNGPVAEERRAIVAGLQPLSPNGVSVHHRDDLVMAYGNAAVWTGDRSCAQPYGSGAGLVITWDGRLDNRNDLLLLLGGDPGQSDAAIALAAFERGGADGLRRLIGDWSVAIWDARRRILHLARDYMGVRPLYYCIEGRSVRWSTSLGEIVTRAGRTDTLDEGFVARFMALRHSAAVTPYKGIRAVPTAHCVSITATGCETRRRFWRLEPGFLRYRNRWEYEERLRALWSEAVEARLRTTGTVWAELSGGLDSSSVVCMADALIKAGRSDASAVQPLSHVALRSPEADERTFISMVESQLGVRSVVMGIEEHGDAREPDFDWITPLVPAGVQAASIRQVRERGGRVLLSGRMGDLVMGGTPDNAFAVLDDLADGRFREAFWKLRLWSRASRKPLLELAHTVAAHAFRPRALRRDEVLNGAARATFNLLTTRLQDLFDSHEAATEMAVRVRPSQRERAEGVFCYSLEARLEAAPELGVTYAYPFAHRPLVEYLLSIPGEELSAPGEPRSLMRRSFAGIVPIRILKRFSKGHYSPAVLRATRPLAADLLPVDRLEVVRRGWICGDRLEAAARSLLDGGGALAAPLQHVLRLEQWLTTRDRRGPAATPRGKEVTIDEVLLA